MKYIHVKLVAVLLIFLIGFSSCTNNEAKDLFKEPATVRYNKQIKEVRELLKSSPNGWKVTYFTDNSQLGGFFYLFKFVDDRNVEMASDFTADATPVSSEYNVNIGQTVQLSFTTESKIHELSDATNYPSEKLKGKGYRGAFEFSYYGKDGEDLLFRDAKHFVELRFQKAIAQDWTELGKHQQMMDVIRGKMLAYSKDGKTNNFFRYDLNTRFVTNKEKDTKLNFGIAFTSKGILVSPAIEVNAIKYKEFILSADKSKLVSMDGKFSIYLVPPPFNLNGWLIFFDNTNVSPKFLTLFNKAQDANRAVLNWDLSTGVFFGTRPGSIEDPSITFMTNGYFGQYILDFSGVPDKPNQLAIFKVRGGINWQYFPHLQPMVDFVSEGSPYRFDFVNPTRIKLTSIANPDVWFVINK